MATRTHFPPDYSLSTRLAHRQVVALVALFEALDRSPALRATVDHGPGGSRAACDALAAVLAHCVPAPQHPEAVRLRAQALMADNPVDAATLAALANDVEGSNDR